MPICARPYLVAASFASGLSCAGEEARAQIEISGEASAEGPHLCKDVDVRKQGHSAQAHDQGLARVHAQSLVCDAAKHQHPLVHNNAVSRNDESEPPKHARKVEQQLLVTLPALRQL